MITVYTCIAGNYDVLVPQPKFPNVQYICFAETDKIYRHRNWTVKPFTSPNDLKNNALINRFHKILCFNNFEEGEFSIYIDGNVQLKVNPEKFVNILIKEESSIGAFRHPQRKSISEEFQACLDQKKILGNDIKVTQDFFKEMKKNGYKEKNDLTANYILARRKDDQELIKAMNEWWEIVLNKVGRDQLSMQYILWRNTLKIIEMDDFLVPSKSFSQIPHGVYSRFLPVILQSIIKKIFIKVKLISTNLFRKIKSS